MIIKILWIIMVSIIIFAFGFNTGRTKLGIEIYDAMCDTLDSVSVKENGADYVKGVLYACEEVEKAIQKEKKGD